MMRAAVLAAGTERPRLRADRIATICLAALVLLLTVAACLAQTFPPLTGRIVDPSGVVPSGRRAAIESNLRNLESKSGIQLVAAVLPSIGDGDIETYANGLFRFWKLGEKDKNNGALLLIATGPRKIRIEVGYGLGGTLTDALSKLIIVNAIAPSLRSGDFGAGVEKGVDDIITVLSGDADAWKKRPYLAPQSNWPLILFGIGVFAMAGLFLWTAFRQKRRLNGGSSQTVGSTNDLATAGAASSSGWSTSSESGSSSDSFSGGGGSSGGGGASGEY